MASHLAYDLLTEAELQRRLAHAEARLTRVLSNRAYIAEATLCQQLEAAIARRRASAEAIAGAAHTDAADEDWRPEARS